MRGTPERESVKASERELVEALAGAPHARGAGGCDGRRARGEKTRDAILARAVQIASQEGLEGLSIGRLATDLGVSKSGLFAHFGSKTELQLATVDAARHIFIHEVIGGSRAGSGIGGLIGLTDSWLDYMRARRLPRRVLLRRRVARVRRSPRPVRDRVASMMGEWLHGPRGSDPGRAGCGRACPRPRQRAARVRDQRARPGRELGQPALRRRCRIRSCAGGDPAGQYPRNNASRFSQTVDEGAARRTLRDQIAKLERELAAPVRVSAIRAESWTGRSAPRAVRACSTSATSRRCATSWRRASRMRAASSPPVPARSRPAAAQIEALVADPGSHKWERVSNDDIGEPGCKYYHSTPRLGLVGMLMGWWRVKISSGCP